MKKAFFVLFLASPSFGALSNFWITPGTYKQPRQDVLPYVNCTTCTISPVWNGDSVTLKAARNETLYFALYMGNSTGSPITDVSVTLSSFTGQNGYGIVSSPRLITGVTNYIDRPIEQFYVRYLQIRGMTQLSWDGTEFEMRDVPEQMRRPCTVNGNNDCVPTGGTLWTDRQNHDKFYPEILVPYEAVAASSFTVAAGSSQAVGFDVNVATTLPSGLYNSEIVVREGITVSTRIPVNLTVRNFSLPNSPSLKAIVYMTSYNINYRHQNAHFPLVSCTSCSITRDHYAQSIRRHKLVATIGDSLANNCNQATKDYPCPEYISRLNGSLYTATSGYAGPGYGLGDEIYSIGTYGSWPSATWSNSITTGASGFCTNISSWSAFFATNYPSARAFVYLADEPASLVNTNKYSTWMSTACSMPSYKLNSMFTGSWVDASVSAPNVNLPVATTFLRASETAWQTASDAYQTTGTTQAWIYNGHESQSSSMYATENDGISPVVNFWMMYKKNVPTWMGWESGYWTDSNNGLGDTDIFTDAKTFGFYSSDNTVKGRTGFQYSNGDGVLMYPGHDMVGSVDYGFDGPIASWRLKMLRRGIQDGDYLTLAGNANGSATDAIVSSMVPDALWEHGCFDALDCSYAYGGRTWPNDATSWENARESLAALIPEDLILQTGLRGSCGIRGRVTIK